jgi:hypothetical protein
LQLGILIAQIFKNFPRLGQLIHGFLLVGRAVMKHCKACESRSLSGPVTSRSRQISGLVQQPRSLAEFVEIGVGAGKIQQRLQLLRSFSQLLPQVSRFLKISCGFVHRLG